MEKTKTHTNFGKHLRTLRKTAGLTLRDVASNINIDSSLLAKIERNQRQPTKQLIKSIASFFNINERELLVEFLSDQIAYKVLNEEGDLSILRVAEEKVFYLKTLHNGNDYDEK